MTLIASTFVMASVALVPAFAFAKENGKSNNGNQEKNQPQMQQQKHQNENDSDGDDRGCLRAFGHLIAPGWIKHNGQFSIGDECNLPFGIGKRFQGTSTNATTTGDVLAINSVTANPGLTSAVIHWNTNVRADSTLFYSTTSPVNVNSSSTLSITQPVLVRDHRITINSLATSTTYYVVVRSQDAAGTVSTSSEIAFTTKTPVAIIDVTPPVITSAVAVTGSTTVKLYWNTNESATTKAYYATSTPVDVTSSTTPFVENAALVTTHAITVSGLATSTPYHMVIESKDASGNVTRSNEFSLTTTSGI